MKENPKITKQVHAPCEKLPYVNPKIVYEGDLEVFASLFCAKLDGDDCAAGPIQS